MQAIRRLTCAAGLVVSGLMWILPASAADTASDDCNRACLDGMADTYMKALLAHNPALAPFAKDVKFSENEVALNLPDGLWNTVTGKKDSDLHFADVKNGEAGLYTVVMENGKTVYFTLRLKVVDHKITEAETIVSRWGDGVEQGQLRAGNAVPAHTAFSPLTHDPEFFQDEPVNQRLTRSRLHDLVYGYFATMENNDGKILTSFEDGCQRKENGGGAPRPPGAPPPVACDAGFKIGGYVWDTRVRERETPLIDQERGLVLVRAFIDHAGNVIDYKTLDGASHTSNIQAPHCWGMLELFKIRNGRISRIEAVYAGVPYGIPSPWYVYEKSGAWVTPAY